MQDLSDAAKSTLPQTVPDSGTPLRALVNMLMLGGGAYVNPVGAGVGLGAAGMYTKPGLKIAELLMASRPAGAQALADKVRIATSPGDLSRLLMAGSRPQYAPSAP